MAKIQLTATSAQVATLKRVATKGNMSLSSLALTSLALTLQDNSLLPAPQARPNRGTRQARKAIKQPSKQATSAQEQHPLLALATSNAKRDAMIRRALRDREIASILQRIVRK